MVVDYWTRMAVVENWERGGAGVKQAAEQALLGSEQDIRDFIEGVDRIQFADDSVAASRLVAVGGPAVREAAKTALRGTPAELDSFLVSGWQAPLDEDRQVEISRIISTAGAGVKEAGVAALKGGPDDRKTFLEEGQFVAQQADDQVAVSQLFASGGPNVKAAAKLALRGTPEDVSEFLAVGQFVARNRDQEHATVAQLAEQAKLAGKQAATATKAAEEASARAVTAAALAKEAAERAARETAAAKNDAKTASVKARQAADAARAAAAAAQQAIGSANAANRAARTAALAAAQTASAAAAAANAANDAYNAAIAAGKDATKSAQAKTAAATALMAATLAEGSIAAAEQAGKASTAAAVAARAALSAGANADAAADAAEAAGGHAAAAGGHAGDARAAAAEARRHATAANNAANRAAALADRAAAAAYDARTAAKSAATHARNAAAAAQEAAEHAGQAANHAQQATKHAEAARIAAETASAAVATAKKTYELARETEANGLATRTDAGVERARTHQAVLYNAVSDAAKREAESRSLDATAAALALEANKPDADVRKLAAQGRQLAMEALKTRGPISQDAAGRALAGTDEEVLDYLRTGWQQAKQRETRERVVELAHLSPYPSVRQAATEALKGTPEQIGAFYTDGQYTAGTADMAVAVSVINSKGGTGVKEASRAALADGSGKALAIFLNITQYSARLADESVGASQLISATTSGPELQAAAKIALAGSADRLHEFMAVGRHTADRKDKLAQQHAAQIRRLIAEASLVAAEANKNRWRAAEAAARANNASAEADKAAAEAQKSAHAAAGYAAEADQAADAAEASAAQAKQSALTARNAAAAADRDAAAAESSAAQAEASAQYARYAAALAGDYADDARLSALTAGKNAADAEKMATSAWQEVKVELEKEITEELKRVAAEEKKRQQEESKKRKRSNSQCVVLVPRTYTHEDCDVVDARNERIRQDFETVWPYVWAFSGGADVQKCIEDPAASDCAMAFASLLPVGKLKLLEKLNSIDGIADASKPNRAKHLPPCPSRHSFPAGTHVLLGDYSTRPIEEIRVGDSVLASDPESGISGPRRVDATIRTPDDRNFTDIELSGAHGGGLVTATDHHPFWSETKRSWINAADLTPNDSLRKPSGETVPVAKVNHWKARQDAYDLTVNDLHTYYVVADKTPILVHNCSFDRDHEWENLQKYVEGGPTSGRAVTNDGRSYPDLVSGNKKLNASLINWVNQTLRRKGKLGNATSSRASDVEQKFAAIMARDGIKEADLVINFPTGPCEVKLGCDQVLDALLEDVGILRVRWKENGVWQMNVYGRAQS
ncbi:polymorphic toxin-type HINT domain-containing protein [Streptomyces sp. TRM49041]|uniref:polymorphic toxin-type HINT domain-containing protein n=1 Tax=Streptomyces sp. TRM49041 TaxID=2603216 RepID=UPI0016568CF5|nr:polymorphic toxin-type HINT domain-containing protein [Streptomyces sp. TRM49041]